MPPAHHPRVYHTLTYTHTQIYKRRDVRFVRAPKLRCSFFISYSSPAAFSDLQALQSATHDSFLIVHPLATMSFSLPSARERVVAIGMRSGKFQEVLKRRVVCARGKEFEQRKTGDARPRERTLSALMRIYEASFCVFRPFTLYL